ncbi:hypothetical protein [Brevibacillus choshinensis]|uniref:Uncharacterized protein n=1 Tax=Brevibacillus choshinensis TaxID=54911 RepID=A0ABX7FLF2_BRECH|nr:hypothetical protein [Brevibacillus choshinensis]QRG66477.1 hypothetical protein JNE38_23590 [Brevibacillus choshinensis]
MTLRKWHVAITSLFILLGVFIFAHRPHMFYPNLPFSSVPKETVVSLLKEKPSDTIIQLAFEDGYVWYGANADHGLEIEKLKSDMDANGWKFMKQDGSGYFFTKGSEKIVITSSMWSSEVVLFKAPVIVHPLKRSDSH